MYNASFLFSWIIYTLAPPPFILHKLGTLLDYCRHQGSKLPLQTDQLTSINCTAETSEENQEFRMEVFFRTQIQSSKPSRCLLEWWMWLKIPCPFPHAILFNKASEEHCFVIKTNNVGATAQAEDSALHCVETAVRLSLTLFTYLSSIKCSIPWK